MSFVNIFGGVVEGLEKGLEKAGKNIADFQNSQYKAMQIQTLAEEKQKQRDMVAQQEVNMKALRDTMKEASTIDMSDWKNSQKAMWMYNTFAKYNGKTSIKPMEFMGFILKSQMADAEMKQKSDLYIQSRTDKAADAEAERTFESEQAELNRKSKEKIEGDKIQASLQREIIRAMGKGGTTPEKTEKQKKELLSTYNKLATATSKLATLNQKKMKISSLRNMLIKEGISKDEIKSTENLLRIMGAGSDAIIDLDNYKNYLNLYISGLQRDIGNSTGVTQASQASEPKIMNTITTDDVKALEKILKGK